MGLFSRTPKKETRQRKTRRSGRWLVDELRELFAGLDRDRSGTICFQELADALWQGGWGLQDSTVAMLLKMTNRKGDGRLSFEDFKELWITMETWSLVFVDFDADHSETIGRGELGRALVAIGYRITPRIGAYILEKFDESGRRELDFDDFVEACIVVTTISKTFQNRDRNGSAMVNYDYETFLLDIMDLVLRLQATVVC